MEALPRQYIPDWRSSTLPSPPRWSSTGIRDAVSACSTPRWSSTRAGGAGRGRARHQVRNGGLNKLRDRLDNARKEITARLPGRWTHLTPKPRYWSSASSSPRRPEQAGQGIRTARPRRPPPERQSSSTTVKNAQGVLELISYQGTVAQQEHVKQAQLHAEIQNIILKHSRTRPPPNSLNGPRPTALRWLGPR